MCPQDAARLVGGLGHRAQQLGGTGQAPNRQEVGRTGQAPNRQEVGGTGQAPNQQEVGGTGQAPNRQENSAARFACQPRSMFSTSFWASRSSALELRRQSGCDSAAESSCPSAHERYSQQASCGILNR
ncbi:MAG: hypothetical protein RBU37_03835 [Myxococcota bacterium]|nr:hypothetical protein [Myxococcota bacterium]